jgi:hypothetical protein
MHEISAGHYPYTAPKLMSSRLYMGVGVLLVLIGLAVTYVEMNINASVVIFLYSLICFVLGAASHIYSYKVLDTDEESGNE